MKITATTKDGQVLKAAVGEYWLAGPLFVIKSEDGSEAVFLAEDLALLIAEPVDV